MTYKKYLIYSLVWFFSFLSCGDRNGGVKNGGPEVVYVSVLAKKVNFRQSPVDDSALVPSRPFLYYGQSGEVLERLGDWVRVKCQFGEEGWVLAETEDTECIREIPPDFFETRLTAFEALTAADDKAKEKTSEPYVVAVIAPLEDFGGRYQKWTVIYRNPDATLFSNDAFTVVTVVGGETDMDGAVWSDETDVPKFINTETGDYVGYGLLDEEDAEGRASLSFIDSDELFSGDLSEAVLELPPVVDGYPGDYFGSEPIASLVLARDTWRVAYYDESHPVRFTITVGCATGKIKDTRYVYSR
jgi:SH3-like domain-containing protein